MRMRYIVTYGLPRSTIRFPHFRKNGTIFENKVIDYKNLCFDFIYNYCLKHFILRRNERDVITMSIGLHVKVPVIFVRF
jgi:hypothetical protein